MGNQGIFIVTQLKSSHPSPPPPPPPSKGYKYRPVQNTGIQVFKDTAIRKWSDSQIRNVCSDKRCYTYSISSLRLLLKVSEDDSVSWLSLKYQVTLTYVI